MNLHGLEFPDTLRYAPEHSLWLREEDDGSVTLGLTAYGCALYGQIFAFTPKRVGMRIERDRGFGVVEFAKAAASARSPLTGELLAVNEALRERPSLINRDCYGEGWMARLQPLDWPAIRDQFPQGETALVAIAERMRLDNFDPANVHVQALQWK
ncbi:glycine cleavage system protein H [Stutzerimonas degradans]|uniref:Glycine cleavage system protein H n=1 Tax=Stutzerimonas degradans TaxID=2968968 RepID=A0A8E2U253_9GAMM|nr:glycine cleavage system protein H [Stutzerimonas degradans]MCQ4276739.1 glycine cleavage system protein H [Stutzerimonas degradans]NHC09802.1 glycine cleavage system protein H [Stutzerimonas degradans]PNF77680.1 glycine cleavage system protein H [Stutzerimonas degradans]QPT20771.1 glycine cleavage system protein H [Stutzerimonas degradans]